jgi:hypothetical protein
VLCAAASFSVAADLLGNLNDAELFKKAQQQVAALPRPELDALAETVATCTAATVGQLTQQYDCERGVNLYFMRFNRGRELDNYVTAVGGLFSAFDNNPHNPTPEMSAAYKRASSDLVTLMRAINDRYRQLEK